MKEFLKKNWFVAAVAVIFLGITIFFVYDQNKDALPGKTARGSGVLYSFDGQDYTADDYYDQLYVSGGEDAAFVVLQRKVLDTVAKTTDEMENEAKALAQQYISYYAQYYGDYAETYLEQQAEALGYENFTQYLLYSNKAEILDREYVKAHSELWSAFAEKYNPRIVSHALIQMEDVNNPTEEELAKLEEAKKAWESGEYTFADFAKKYSDDAGSAVNGGKIGYLDTNSYNTSVKEFVDNGLKPAAGETTEWFTSTYGYHIIMVDSVASDDCLEEVACLESFFKMYENIEKAAMWDKMTELGVKFNSEELETSVKEALGVNADGKVEVKPAEETEAE